MSKKISPQYVEVEQPFGCDPPVVHCPICGNATITIGEQGGVVTPCPHLAFIYVGEVGEFEFQSEDFLKRAANIDLEGLSWETFKTMLKKAGYGNNMLAIEITYGGMANGPVWYTDIFGFDYASLGKTEQKTSGHMDVDDREVHKRIHDLSPDARRKLVEDLANSHKDISDVERELLKAVYAYEEVLFVKHHKHVRANYTWRMIRKLGIIPAAERAVNRKIDPAGYEALATMGLHNLTFEAVMVRHPDQFSQQAVARAKERLESLSAIPSSGGRRTE